MKKIILLITCIIFGFYHTQINHQTITRQSINKKLTLAEKASFDPKKKTDLYLQILNEAKKINDKASVLTSVKKLMILYHNTDENEKSIDYSYEVEKIAKETNDNESIAIAHIERGTALSDLGLYDQNYKELNKAKYYVNKLTDKNKRHLNMSLIYQGLTAGYYVPKKAHQDTILLYFKKSLQEAEKITDNGNDRSTDEKYDMISYIYMNMGMHYAMIANPKRPDIAEEYLLKSLSTLNNRKFTKIKVEKIPILNYLGHFYSEQGKNTEAIDYARKVLKLEKVTHSPTSRVAAYATLTNSFESLKSKDSTLKYMSLYSNLSDSLAHSNKISADNTIKKISSQKDKAHKNNILLFTAVFFVIFLGIITGGWFYWVKNQNKLHQRYESIIENLKKEKKIAEVEMAPAKVENRNTENSLIISEETITLLLAKLSKFEKSEKFLKKDLSLTTLSNSLNTNPRYLSEVIKQYKNKSFNNYINGLRIQFITNKLYDTPIFREYKISYLAETCGFSSREVFAVIFKKETGVSPSYFINQLKKSEPNENTIQ